MWFVVAMVVLVAGSAPGFAYDPFETTDEARARHSADRYEQYRQNDNSAPMGGYRERLGDPAPAGTINPGFSNNGQVNGSNSGYGNGSTGSSWTGLGGTNSSGWGR